MSWLALALGAAFFYALQGAWTKRISPTIAAPASTWAIFAFAFPLLALYLGLHLALGGAPPPPAARFWPAVGVNATLSVLSFWLYVSALERGHLGLTYPLLALTPILLVPVEWLLLGDTPAPRGLAGIFLVVSGIYLLGFDPARAGVLEPLRAVARDPGARRMLGVAAIWAVSATVDRVAVLAASPALYGVALTAAVGAIMLPLVSRRGGGVRRVLGRETRGLLAVQGVLFAATFICQMEALRFALAANVVTIKRSGALLTVLLGALFFGEPFARYRMAGTAIILVGVLLVARG